MPFAKYSPKQKRLAAAAKPRNNAMRGHGGYYAEVLEPGRLALGDAVVPQAHETAERNA